LERNALAPAPSAPRPLGVVRSVVTTRMGTAADGSRSGCGG
jgi:hypothetical protein